MNLKIYRITYLWLIVIIVCISCNISTEKESELACSNISLTDDNFELSNYLGKCLILPKSFEFRRNDTTLVGYQQVSDGEKQASIFIQTDKCFELKDTLSMFDSIIRTDLSNIRNLSIIFKSCGNINNELIPELSYTGELGGVFVGGTFFFLKEEKQCICFAGVWPNNSTKEFYENRKVLERVTASYIMMNK